MTVDELLTELRKNRNTETNFADLQLCMMAATVVEQQREEIQSMKKEIQALKANSMIQSHIIENNMNPIERDKMISLIMKNSELQKNNREAMKLLKLAVSEIKERECDRVPDEVSFPYFDREIHCKGCKIKWEHEDEYKLLKERLTNNG